MLFMLETSAVCEVLVRANNSIDQDPSFVRSIVDMTLRTTSRLLPPQVC